jgi:hypothetical protein
MMKDSGMTAGSTMRFTVMVVADESLRVMLQAQDDTGACFTEHAGALLAGA